MPESMSEIQKIQRQPTKSVKTPPKIRPILWEVNGENKGGAELCRAYMKPKEPAAPQKPRAVALPLGSGKARAM